MLARSRGKERVVERGQLMKRKVENGEEMFILEVGGSKVIGNNLLISRRKGEKGARRSDWSGEKNTEANKGERGEKEDVDIVTV